MNATEAVTILYEAEENCECPTWAVPKGVIPALDFLVAELTRKDEALGRLVDGVTPLVEPLRPSMGCKPFSAVEAEAIAALDEAHAALGDQP